MNVNYFKPLWRNSLVMLLFCFGLTSLWGQHNISQVGSENVYTQTFDSFTGTTQTIPAGWTLSAAPSGYYNRSNGTYATNNLYSLRDNASSTDNAIGGKVAANSGTCSSTGTRTITFSVKNMTGATITGFVLNWNVEQYSQGGRATTLNLTHNFGGTTTGTSTFTATTGTEGNLSSIVSTARGITISELTLANEATGTFTFTICTGSGSGNNGHVGIDDFTLYAVGPTTPSISIDPTTITGLQSVENGAASTPASFTMTGNTLDGSDVTIIADGEVFEISATQNGAYSDIVELEAYDGTEQTIWVRLAANQTAGVKNGTILIDGGGIEEPIEVEVQGNVITSDPVLIVSEESLEGLTYTFNAGPSTPKSFTISGLNMEDADGDMMLMFAETSDFEMSLEAASNYQDDLLIENYDGTETTIYVRLKSGLAIGAAYSDILEIMSDYDVEGSVLVFGEVLTPPASTTVSETALSGFHYNVGNGPSAEQTFTVSGAYLTGNITVTAPTNYQVSLSSGSDFQNSVILTPTDGFVNETTVYVRLNSGLGLNNYNGNITISATGVANKTIALTGSVTCGASALPYSEDFESVTTPNVPNCTTVVQGGSGNLWTTSSPNESGFTSKALTYQWHNDNDGDTWFFTNGLQLEGGQSYRLSFRYGNNSTSYSESLRVAYGTSNSIAAMTTELADYPNINDNTPHSVTINFEPATTGTYYIGFQAYSEPDNYRLYVDDILVEENVPTISVEPVTVPAFTAVTDGSDSENIIITGILLSDNIDIALSGINADQFSLSATSLDSAGGTLTVTYEPTTVGNHNATVTLSSTGADDVILNINGTATLGVPVATEATLVNHNSFTANWEAVAGATSYEIDAYTKIGGGSGVDVENFSGIVISGNLIGEGSIFNEGWSFLSDGTRQQYTSNSNYGASSPSFAFTLTGDYIQTAIYPNNIQSFSFWAKAQGGSTSSTLIEGFNGTSWVTIATLVNSSISSGTTIVYDLVDLEIDNIVQIRMVFTKNSGNLSIDDVTVTYEGTTLSPIAEDPFTVSAPATSLNVTDLDPETTYYYVVRAVSGEETSANSNEIEVETLAAPTAIVWMIDGGWSNHTGPTIDDDVIIEGELSIPTDFESFSAQTLTVEGSLTIEANASVTVEGKITNNGEFTVESDGILYQNNYTGTNEGNITVKRAANPMKRLDYTLWSSPVSGMLLNQFSNISNNGGTGTIWNRVYELGATAWESVWDSYANATASTETFATAKGYLYRAFNSYDPVETTIFTGEFTGVPNNGNYSISTPNAFDAIGNPYPSPIEANDFINGNTGVSAVYFWTNVNSSNGTAYTHNNWASYTTVGGVGVAIGGDSENIDPDSIPADDMHIQPGQGFVVYTALETESVAFTNSMRVSSNGSFFRQMATEKSRFWLNLSNEEVVFNQILVGYMDNATQGVDTGIDGKMFAYEGNALYSIIENSDENYVIQGRSLPFEASDVVALGFRAVNSGSFTISLNNFDGLFTDNQNIYLKDNFTQAVHNLKEGAYTFVSEEGIFNTRFEVVYQTTMSVENPVANNANWVVYSQEDGYQIQTQGFELQNVTVFDLLGRTIYTANAQGTVHQIPALGADSVYIVKVTTTDNVVLSKKVK